MVERKKKPKKLAIIDEQGCSGCEICIDFCPVENCIIKVENQNHPGINPVCKIKLDLCIGCALCERYCPWETIYIIPFEEYESISDEQE